MGEDGEIGFGIGGEVEDCMNQKSDTSYGKFRDSRFFQYFYMLIDEVNKLKNNGVNFFFFQTPLPQNIVGLSEFEQERLANWEFDFNHITEKDCNLIKKIYSEDIDLEYLKEVYDGSYVFFFIGRKYLADFRSKYVNIISGRRITYYQPQNYGNKIYVFGQCTTRGTGVEDKHTIPSFLQEEINQHYPASYKVINMAIGCGSDLYDDLMNLREIVLDKGDIVIFCTNLEIVPTYLFKKHKIPYYDCSKLFDHPNKIGEWFTDSTLHTNAKGNQAIGTYMGDVLEKTNSLYLAEKPEEELKKQSKQEDILEKVNHKFELKELNEYLQWVKKHKKQGEKHGAIVMNCNPFTRGHQYLIEIAASKVDVLYIFVVEENRSFFPFKDRMDLVKKGTAHLNNVVVLPSGKFIISATTFPGYFYKDGNKEIEVDTSFDIEIFGKYIAPALDIKIRFAGEEPNDFVTRKYNEEMEETLPKHNVEFIEIKRKEAGGQVISASLVRKLLEKRDFEKIKPLVPQDTFNYLISNYD